MNKSTRKQVRAINDRLSGVIAELEQLQFNEQPSSIDLSKPMTDEERTASAMRVALRHLISASEELAAIPR